MSDSVSTSPIHVTQGPLEGAEVLDEVLIASSPDSYSFQVGARYRSSRELELTN